MKVLAPFLTAAVVFIAVGTAACAAVSQDDTTGASAPSASKRYTREEPFIERPLNLYSGDHWIGNAVAYGPHRDGQYPGGPSPTRSQLLEDLLLMANHWNLIRVYGASGPAGVILDIIRDEGIDMKVMLGVWIDAEDRLGEDGKIAEPLPDARAANRREIESAVRLAAAYPDIVLALCVGNETQVFWTSHPVPMDRVIASVREVRVRTTVPVTVADDYNFWNKPASRALAREVDFIVTHMHPLWNGLQLENALEWTKKTFAEIQAFHPECLVVLGETGWATQKHDVGEQATLIKGQPGETQQKVFYDAVTAWADRDRVPLFFFEAFDENWKGGEHPDEVEKHWGLYRADRTPKEALVGGE